jgi:hypothetical protein
LRGLSSPEGEKKTTKVHIRFTFEAVQSRFAHNDGPSPAHSAEPLVDCPRVIRDEDSGLLKAYLKVHKYIPTAVINLLPVPIASNTRSGQAIEMLQIMALENPQEMQPHFINALEQGNDPERIAAAWCVQNLAGYVAAPAEPALCKNLRFKSSAVKISAFQALLGLPDVTETTFSEMAVWLIREGPAFRGDLSDEFAGLIARHQRSRSTLPLLKIPSTNTNLLIRFESSYAAWEIDPAEHDCSADLLNQFQQPASRATFQAARYLSQSGRKMCPRKPRNTLKKQETFHFVCSVCFVGR